jgi:hypothetical protein
MQVPVDGLVLAAPPPVRVVGADLNAQTQGHCPDGAPKQGIKQHKHVGWATRWWSCIIKACGWQGMRRTCPVSIRSRSASSGRELRSPHNTTCAHPSPPLSAPVSSLCLLLCCPCL